MIKRSPQHNNHYLCQYLKGHEGAFLSEHALCVHVHMLFMQHNFITTVSKSCQSQTHTMRICASAEYLFKVMFVCKSSQVLTDHLTEVHTSAEQTRDQHRLEQTSKADFKQPFFCLIRPLTLSPSVDLQRGSIGETRKTDER